MNLPGRGKLAISLLTLIIIINMDRVCATDVNRRHITMDDKTINVSQSNTCEVETWETGLLECASYCNKINCGALAISISDDGNRKCALISYIDELPVGLWEVWKTYGTLVQVE